jgi:hypothetical protein
MRRLLLVLTVAAGMLVLTPQPSWACSCAMADPATHAQRADTIIAGTLDWTSTNGLERAYQVEVDQVFKGTAVAKEKLTTKAAEASCGLGALATGRRYLFFVRGTHGGAMRVDLCGGSQEYSDALAAQVQQATGPPRQPDPLPTSGTFQLNGDDRTLPTIAGIVGGSLVAVALLVGAVAGVRRLRSRS